MIMFLTFKYNNLLSDNSKFLPTCKKQLQRTNFTCLYSTGAGSAFEGFIIEEIIQGLRAVEAAPWAFSFYRTRGGAEVDLILTSPTGIHIPVEINFGVSVRREQLKSLTKIIESEQCPYGIVINNSDDVQLLTENIIQLPTGGALKSQPAKKFSTERLVSLHTSPKGVF